MARNIDEVAFAAHSFEYDGSSIDEPLREFLQIFYTLSDDKENANEWAACFAKDAIMKRKGADVLGREAIAKANEESWNGQASRQHIVYKVFPFNAGTPDEVMLYGLSKYVYEDSGTGQMPWSARIKLARSESDGIQIYLYHIYAGALQRN
ncbi:hypothetical protein GQ53DRAFT_751293 [Thozetella sp. PMI_491]|nr:hypothetical protein GQ53DRAFT_751293 [Thozetella sp. PMI_491]